MNPPHAIAARSAASPSPRRWLVSRHPGAQLWLQHHGIVATTVHHLDPTLISPGDQVYGTLPLHLAAEVCARGARFFFLALDVPVSLRGQEIDMQTMIALGARLEEFIVLPASGHVTATG